jgi:hypothetical protein
VFGGMILASFIGIFAIPPLYVMFQAIREWLRPGARPAAVHPSATPAHQERPNISPRSRRPVARRVQCLVSVV